MNKKLILPLATLLLTAALLAFTSYENKNAKAEEEVKELILRSYVNGAFNTLVLWE